MRAGELQIPQHFDRVIRLEDVIVQQCIHARTGHPVDFRLEYLLVVVERFVHEIQVGMQVQVHRHDAFEVPEQVRRHRKSVFPATERHNYRVAECRHVLHQFITAIVESLHAIFSVLAASS